MFCRQCGSRSDAGRYCTQCGHVLNDMPDTGRSQSLAVMEPTTPSPTGSFVSIEPALAAAVASPSPVVQTQMVGAASQSQSVTATATNVTVNVAGPQIRYEDKTGHGLLLRGIWFVFAGWWLGEVWLLTAWLFNLSVIGLPLGLMMINKLPMVMTLKKQSSQLNMSMNADGTYVLTRKHIDQRPFLVRAAYFVFIGWWMSLLWAELAYGLAILIVTLPISFMMFDRMPAVTTLARY